MSIIVSKLLGISGLLTGFVGLTQAEHLAGLGLLVAVGGLLALNKIKHGEVLVCIGQMLWLPSILLASLYQHSVLLAVASTFFCLPALLGVYGELKKLTTTLKLKNIHSQLALSLLTLVALFPVTKEFHFTLESTPSLIAMKPQMDSTSLKTKNKTEPKILERQGFSKTISPSDIEPVDFHFNYPGGPYPNRQIAAADRAQFAEENILVIQTIDKPGFFFMVERDDKTS